MDIKRADAVRYFILYLYGGVYMDTDFTCLKDLAPLIASNPGEAVLGNRHAGMNISGRTGQGFSHNISALSFEIPNAFMAVPPAHPFMAFVIGHLRALEANSVLRSTGPSMLTAAFRAWNEHGLEQVRLLSRPELYPDCGNSGSAKDIRVCSERYPGAWAATFWSMSWTTNYHRLEFVDDNGDCIRDDPYATWRCTVNPRNRTKMGPRKSVSKAPRLFKVIKVPFSGHRQSSQPTARK